MSSRSGLNDVLYDVSKRDDDAQIVIMQNGDAYLETQEDVEKHHPAASAYMSDPTVPTMLSKVIGMVADETLLEDAMQARPLDVRVTIIYRIFMAHQVLLFVAMMFALPFYYWPVSHTFFIVAAVLGSVGWALSYTMLVAWAWAYWPYSTVYIPVGIIVVWMICWSTVFGVAAGMSQESAPFVLLVMMWSQCITIIVYCKRSLSQPNGKFAALYMGTATVAVWLLSILSYESGGDWITGVIVLLIALAFIPYNVYQIRSTEGRFSVSMQDSVRAVVEFYCAIPMALLERIPSPPALSGSDYGNL